MYNTIQSRSVLRVPHALSLKISIDRYTLADSFTDTFVLPGHIFLLVLQLDCNATGKKTDMNGWTINIVETNSETRIINITIMPCGYNDRL